MMLPPNHLRTNTTSAATVAGTDAAGKPFEQVIVFDSIPAKDVEACPHR
jgi:hypothetical protein